MAHGPRNVFLCLLQTTNLGNRWNDFSQNSYSSAKLVFGHVVVLYPKNRIECRWYSKRTWFGKLPNGLVDVAKTTASHGPHWTWATEWVD